MDNTRGECVCVQVQLGAGTGERAGGQAGGCESMMVQGTPQQHNSALRASWIHSLHLMRHVTPAVAQHPASRVCLTENNRCTRKKTNGPKTDMHTNPPDTTLIRRTCYGHPPVPPHRYQSSKWRETELYSGPQSPRRIASQIPIQQLMGHWAFLVPWPVECICLSCLAQHLPSRVKHECSRRSATHQNSEVRND